MTELSMKQFISLGTCLKCKGCCRYKEEDSHWRPKIGAGDQAYVKTIPVGGLHHCRFLNGEDNTCGIYIKRPFECDLYPFILSKTPDAIKVYAHLSCHYVQDHLGRAEFDAYVAYLKEFFRRMDIRAFLSDNKAMFHDYSSYAPELLHLFDLSFL